MKESKVPTPRHHIIESDVDGDLCLYDPMSEKVTVLNGTASDIWRLVDGTMTKDQIVEALAASYGVDHTQIADDVSSTITALHEADLIE